MITWKKLSLWWRENAPQGEFWRIAAAVFLFNAGVSVYLFLYNLFLLDLGLREQKIGVLVSAVAVGSLASTVPMGIVARRAGTRRTLIVTLLLLALGFGARSLFAWYPALLVWSFISGVMLSGWVVCLSPAVAAAVEEPKRPFSFSILFAIAVATSSIGGLGGANMPRLWRWLAIQGVGHAISAMAAKRITLLIACALTATAAWPVVGLRGDAALQPAHTSYNFSPFLKRFLIASACWGAAIGFFNPFTSVYFTRYLHVPLVRLGMLFAITQIAQTIAVLWAPSLIRRAGLVTGIVWTQLATAISLGLLSMTHTTLVATILYCGYMAAQHTAEPGIQTLLMGGVADADRSGASALNFFVVSLAQAGAAALGGMAIAHFGYPFVLAGVAVAVAGSAALFRTLCAAPRSQVQDAVALPFVDVTPVEVADS